MRFTLAGLVFCTSCLAQESSVVITAPRFPEEIRRLPASVTVITEEDIRRSAARTLPELLSSEVGITMKDFYGNNAAYTSIDLRGFGATGSQNTLILLDGRRLNDFDLSGVQWPAIPLASIERVEIVRGAGGVLPPYSREEPRAPRPCRKLRHARRPALRELRYPALRHQRLGIRLRLRRLP